MGTLLIYGINFSHTWPIDSRSLSDKSLRGTPKYRITQSSKALLTVRAVWSFDGIEIEYFEKQSTNVITYSILRLAGKGLTMSIDKVSHGPSETMVLKFSSGHCNQCQPGTKDKILQPHCKFVYPQ